MRFVIVGTRSRAGACSGERFVLATLLGEPARFRDISTRARGVELLGGMELFETGGIVSIEERLAVGVARADSSAFEPSRCRSRADAAAR